MIFVRINSEVYVRMETRWVFLHLLWALLCVCNHKLKNLSQGVICFLQCRRRSSLCTWVSDYGCCQKRVSG